MSQQIESNDESSLVEILREFAQAKNTSPPATLLQQMAEELTSLSQPDRQKVKQIVSKAIDTSDADYWIDRLLEILKQGK